MIVNQKDGDKEILVCVKSLNNELLKGRNYRGQFVNGFMTPAQWVVINDLGKKESYFPEFFLTIQEWRQKQLEKLI